MLLGYFNPMIVEGKYLQFPQKVTICSRLGPKLSVNKITSWYFFESLQIFNKVILTRNFCHTYNRKVSL